MGGHPLQMYTDSHRTCRLLVFVMTYRWVLAICLVILIAAGVWWWHWQAPRRTFNVFIDALAKGDINRLYELMPAYERKFISIDLVRRAYYDVIKPYLLSQRRLVRIWRTASYFSEHRGTFPELYLRHVRVVRFYLWFQDDKGDNRLTVVVVQRPPDEEKWRVPFSTFVYNTCLILWGEKADQIMAKMGFKMIAHMYGGPTWILVPPTN